MAKNNDFAVALGSEQSGHELDYFFGEQSEPSPEKAEADEGGEEANPLPRRQEKATASTHIRVSSEQKKVIEQYHQAYCLATKKAITLSEFLALCVRRALPHISKDAADIIRLLGNK